MPTVCISTPVNSGPPLLVMPQLALTTALAATSDWPLKRAPQATSDSM